MNKYVILTIGDGLVSQIPSLLISLVNRYSGYEGIEGCRLWYGTDQTVIRCTKSTCIMVGAIIAGLGIVTPLPTVIFLALGLVFIVVTGRVIAGTIETAQIENEVDTEEAAAEEIRQPENVNSLLQVDPIELEFGYGIIPLADVNQGGDLLDRVVMIRRQIALELRYGSADYPTA